MKEQSADWESLRGYYSGNSEPIAIVGIGCHFPGGVADPDSFWELLKSETDAIEEIPDDRWSKKTFYSETRSDKGKTVSKWGGFLRDIDKFDPQFFGISPREAKYMDPQQRLLLETSWEALEDAGLVVEKLQGSDTGVFMGAFTLDYKIVQFGSGDFELIGTHTAVGTMMTLVANRISHAYDFRGPSITIDTACSSSMVAVHIACQSLRNKECSMALAGGVLLNIAPQYTIAESQGGFLSEDGRSKAYDSRANGYVRGEGVAAIVLKSLSKALEDNDEIYSVILGTAVNQDGATNGITVPRGDAQKDVITRACKQAGVEPHQIQYVEAHGTGTPVGDPIEANSLGEVYGKGRDKDKPCIVGSVKTNIGHTEPVAGAAGLIKASLCLKNKAIPKHLHIVEVNPKINFPELGLKLPLKMEPWPEHEGVAMAGVNSFGFGGTNSHAIIAEAPQKKKYANQEPKKPVLLPFSARMKKALMDLLDSYKRMLNNPGFNESLYDLGYSMSFRRDHHSYRLGIVVQNLKELAEKLETLTNDEEEFKLAGENISFDQGKGIVYVFTGMGPQWWAMGRQLIETEPIFRDMIKKCDKELSKYTEWSLWDELTCEKENSRMHKTMISQPANFAIQVALAELWRSWGIYPDAIVGHSTGEVAAFYAAGVYSFEDAVKVIYYRSSLQQTLAGKGKMLAVGLSEEKAREEISEFRDKVGIAAINSFNGVTLSGDAEVLDIMAGRLTEKDVFNKFLKVEIPFHSPVMDEIKDRVLEALKDIEPRIAKIKLYSTVTGLEANGTELDASYWWKNIRQTVLFAPAANEMVKDGYKTFIEVGPHPVLFSSIDEILKANKGNGLILSSLRREEDELRTMLQSLSGLYSGGYSINWGSFFPEKGKFVKLPHYPWQNDSYWLESENNKMHRLGIYDSSLLGYRLNVPTPCWETEIKAEVVPFINDHIIQGNIVFPAAGYIEMGLEAVNKEYGDGFYVLSNIEFAKALFINKDSTTKVKILLNQDNGTFKIFNTSNHSVASECVSYGRIIQMQNMGNKKRINPEFFEKLISEKKYKEYSSGETYRRFSSLGFQYGPAFQGISSIWIGEKETISKIILPSNDTGNVYKLNPSTIDACFQSIIAINFDKEASDDKGEIRLPVGVDRFAVYREAQDEMWAWSKMISEDESASKSDILLYNKNGEIVAEITGFTVQALDSVRRDIPLNTLDSWLYQLDWVEKNLEIKSDRGVESGRWVILSDKNGIGLSLGKYLEEKGQDVIQVYAGSSDKPHPDNKEVYINPDSNDDFVELLQSYKTDKPLKGIIHLWNLDIEPFENISPECLDEAKKIGAYSVIRIVQTLAEFNEKLALWIATKGAQSIENDTHSIEVAQSPVWGMSRIIANQEYVGMWGGIADFDPQDIESSIKQLALDILHSDGDDQLVYRKEKRYVGRVNNIKNMTKPFDPYFKKDAAYLVTGAFGALGKLTVNWMLEKGARHFVLMARTSMPPREEWNSIEADSSIGQRIELIREIEENGGTVNVASVDVSNEEALKAYFDKYKADDKPPVKGIISTIGIVRDKLIPMMDEETFSSVLESKVNGTWLLHKMFENEDLDFFITYSSIAALVTSSGQSNYAAANGFLDALAQYRRQKGLPALSIGWGPWAVGMVKDLNLTDLYVRKGMTPITPRAGMQVLERLFGQNIPYAAVVEADWERVIESGPRPNPPYIDHLRSSEDGSLDSNDNKNNFADIYKGADEAGKMELVSEALMELVCKALHLKRANVELEMSLNVLGIDSMVSTELKNRIELKFGVNVPLVELLNNSSLRALTENIKGKLDEALMPISVEQLVASTSEEVMNSLLQKLDGLSEEDVLKLLGNNDIEEFLDNIDGLSQKDVLELLGKK